VNGQSPGSTTTRARPTLCFRLVYQLDSKPAYFCMFSLLIANKGYIYLLRAEIIALHSASSYPGAQFYMECAQINISSSSAGKRGDVPRRHLSSRAAAFSPKYVSLPGAYAGTDPGITFQMYWPKPTNYTIPGPRPLVC
jgi:hypothetical protein